jgi:hypothetical protein
MAEMIDMITAMSPGTIIDALSSVSLYHTRPSATTGAGPRGGIMVAFCE